MDSDRGPAEERVTQQSEPGIIPATAERGRAGPDHLEVCEAAARAGGRVLADWRGRFGVSQKGRRDLVTEADVAAQREIRRIVLDAFPDHGFVGEESLPEMETTPARPDGLRWIVDPLDGTTNYVHGFPAYCVSVALARGDEVLVGAIFDPERDECFTARAGGGAFLDGRPIRAGATTDPEDALVAISFPPHVTGDSGAVADFLAVVPHVHSVRRTGSTAINLAYVACGRLDAFWVRRIASWDVAAGLLLVAEAGGAVGPFAGGPAGPLALDRPVFIAAATPGLLAELRHILPP
jgi:myo-inositol-1(or 4)-monophosphatase